jgi:putative ABC transport system ATP-binding protein
MIRTRNLAFRYGDDGFELRPPDLEIAAGEQVALIGPSGCGKTTLVNLIAGILPPAQGEVQVAEFAISQLSDAERRNFRISRIGFIFQAFELIDYLTVTENILLPYLVNPSLSLDCGVRTSAEELAESVGLGGHLQRRPEELSQGEKQRLAICRALITQPSVILADEPTGNLDADNTALIMQLIQARARERGATLLMITHDRSLLERFDRVIDLEGA